MGEEFERERMGAVGGKGQVGGNSPKEQQEEEQPWASDSPPNQRSQDRIHPITRLFTDGSPDAFVTKVKSRSYYRQVYRLVIFF